MKQLTLQEQHDEIKHAEEDSDCGSVSEYVESYYRRNPIKFRVHKINEIQFPNQRNQSRVRTHVTKHIQKTLANLTIEKTEKFHIYFDKNGVIHNQNLKTGKFQRVPEEI